ncbi:MAG: preprotein translocase subunit YajC [Tepidisphaeraceae bacterium]
MNLFVFLAQVPATQPDIPWYANPQIVFMGLIVGVFVVMLYSGSRGKKNEQKLRDEMLANMKRGDRVETIGGILGSVVEVRDSEVVLKVDESSNTKIKFARAAIKRVMTEDETPTK